MKQKLLYGLMATTMLVLVFSFRQAAIKENGVLTGAWQMNENGQEEVLLFADGYMTHTSYSKESKKFIQARGGTFTLDKAKLTVNWEFDTRDKEQVGQSQHFPVAVNGDKMTTSMKAKNENWERFDNGKDGLAGLWQITARKQEEGLVPIHQTGTRKTVKILTGKRFQWAAIDPGTKGFMGTGGGTYTFKDGKYTEHIEFFSRDSSRVGSSLSFDGKLENGNWHHSGLSSRGEPIYEVWSRKN